MGNDEIEIEFSHDIHAVNAAEQAKGLAKKLGFSEVDQTKIAIAVSELARNIVAHCEGRGRIVIKPIAQPGRVGVLVIAEDKGPGIADVEKALQGGNSTGGSLGEGLGGAKRLMDEFNIETKGGDGTTVTAKKWKH